MHEMEFNNPADEKIGSPSQGNIGRLQPLKRDVESLEDFEDITKGFSSVKDITAQFLQYETDNRNKLQSDESPMRTDEHFDIKPQSNYQEPSRQTQNTTDFDPKRVGSDETHADSTSEFLINEKPDSVGDSKKPLVDTSSDLMHFGQMGLDSEKTKFEEDKASQINQNSEDQNLTIVDNVKLRLNPSNDEISNDSEELAFVPKKGESSPLLYNVTDKDATKKSLLERKSSDGIDMPFNSPLSIYGSEPGLTREHGSRIVQGDGFHVKESNDGDQSDNEDIVPEPIAKDYPEIGEIEETPFFPIGLDDCFFKGKLHAKIESLIYWRNPKKSGVVFGSVLAILLSLTTFSLISVAAYSSLFVLLPALSFRIYQNVRQAIHKTSDGHPFKTYLLPIIDHSSISAVIKYIKEYLDFDLTLNPDKVKEISDLIVSVINKTVTKSRSLFLVEDLFESIKFGMGLWCLTYLGAWFNGLSLLIVAFVGLFTLPKVYENNQTQIDANLKIVKNKINDITEKLQSVIRRKTEGAKDKSE